MSAPSFISKLDVERNPRIVKVDRFKAPPRVRRLKLWALSRASIRAGRADGQAGTPAADDPALPSAIRRLVEEANAFMGGAITQRYVTERNRILHLQNHIEAAANERKHEITSLGGVPEAAPASDATTAGVPKSAAAPEDRATEAKPRKAMARAATTRDFSAVRAQGNFTYVLWLGLIFIGEAVVNKKAFELFSESDRTLWLMVTGVAVAVVVCAHLLGKFWKRFADEGRDKQALMFLAVIALAGAAMLGTMRYLAVDQERQDQISLLNNQIQAASTDLARNQEREQQLAPKAKLTPTEVEELRLARSRIAGAEAQLSASEGRLQETQTLQGIERPAIALPLYILLNLVLIGVATALSYHHADPAAERERQQDKGRRRRERRERLSGWFAAALDRSSQRREAKRLREELARTEEIATRARQAAQVSEAARLKRINELQREVEHLRASYKTADRTLEEMQKAYCAACDSVEYAYRAIAERYWNSQNQNAQRPLKQLKDAWEKGRRRALKKGMPMPEKPEGLDWRQPAAQKTPLGFNRPAELGCAELPQPG